MICPNVSEDDDRQPLHPYSIHYTLFPKKIYVLVVDIPGIQMKGKIVRVIPISHGLSQPKAYRLVTMMSSTSAWWSNSQTRSNRAIVWKVCYINQHDAMVSATSIQTLPRLNALVSDCPGLPGYLRYFRFLNGSQG